MYIEESKNRPQLLDIFSPCQCMILGMNSLPFLRNHSNACTLDPRHESLKVEFSFFIDFQTDLETDVNTLRIHNLKLWVWEL